MRKRPPIHRSSEYFSGPTGPVAGEVRARDEATAAKEWMTLERLRSKLALFRSGDDAAGQEIIGSLMWVVFAKADKDKFPDRISGRLYETLDQCVRRLRNNRKTAEEVAEYIGDALHYDPTQQAREESRRLLPTPAQKATARRHGKKLAPVTRLAEETVVKGQPVNRLEQPDAPRYDNNGAVYRAPSNRTQRVPAMKEKYDELIASAHSLLEKNVLGLLEVGHSQEEIAVDLKITRGQVRQILKTIRDRAERAA